MRKVLIGILVGFIILSIPLSVWLFKSFPVTKNAEESIKSEGYVVYKKSENNTRQILLMNKINRDQIENTNLNEIERIARTDPTAIWLFVNEKNFNSIKLADKVIVWHDSIVAPSNPPQSGAQKIKILE